jgi:hypothetical protein
MRRLGLADADVDWILANPDRHDRDRDDRPRYIGRVAGKRVRVVLAADDPELVVTVHERRS